MFKRIARYILRNELSILNEDVQIARSNADYHFGRAEGYKAQYLKLKDEHERFASDVECSYIELRQRNEELNRRLHCSVELFDLPF